MNKNWSGSFMAAAAAVLLWGGMASTQAGAQTVKITSVGSHTDELCARDRAMIFEDPSGVRLLYDPGHSVLGADDPRLGEIHAVLLSHAHGDHFGDMKMKALNEGPCDAPTVIPAGFNGTTAEIAAAKKAAMIAVVDLSVFMAKKIENITGKPVEPCPVSNGATIMPVATPCRSNAHLGGSLVLKTANAQQGVEITVVYAAHANSLPLSAISEPERKVLAANGLAYSPGPPVGFVIKFTNGLVAYLSGDTGIHTEMKTVVADYHKATLAVMNLGPNAVTPQSAAYAMNELVRPASVIVTHVNETGTIGGKVNPKSRTAAFIKLMKAPVYLPLSGHTFEFDGKGHCAAGCGS